MVALKKEARLLKDEDVGNDLNDVMEEGIEEKHDDHGSSASTTSNYTHALFSKWAHLLCNAAESEDGISARVCYSTVQ